MPRLILMALAILIGLQPIATWAAVTTFDLRFESGTGAVATGQVTFDTASIVNETPNGILLVPASPDAISLASSSVLSFYIDITGASRGNGHFESPGLRFSLFSPHPLDFTRELVGQTWGNGCAFAVSCFDYFNAGHVVVDAGYPPWDRPTLAGFFSFATSRSGLTNQVNGDVLTLTSMVPVSNVPEPIAPFTFIPGLALLLAISRRRGSTTR